MNCSNSTFRSLQMLNIVLGKNCNNQGHNGKNHSRTLQSIHDHCLTIVMIQHAHKIGKCWRRVTDAPA